ncbi:MAG: circadian clock KaiB family protein [Chitinophagaceae bacterium]
MITKKNIPAGASRPRYIFRLFVSGLMPNSVQAIKNITAICEIHFKGNHELEIIDIYQQPDLAIAEQIIVLPVLIIMQPLPERRIFGDLSNRAIVMKVLNPGS